MNSLVNYGSDDDCDDSSEEKQFEPPQRSYRKPGTPKQDDANYDEVQMSLSEDSSDEFKPTRDPPRRQSRDRDDHHKEEVRRWDNQQSRNSPPKSRDDYRARKERTISREDKDKRDDRDRREDKEKKEGRERNVARNDREDDRPKNSYGRDEDRTRERVERYRDKEEDTSDRYHRGGDKEDDRHKDRRDDRRGKSKERHNRDDRYRDRKDRDRRRSRSPRERRRSRTPKRSEKSRSKSKERVVRPSGYSKRYDRANNKMDRLDKMGIEIKTPDCQYIKPSDLQKSMSDEKNDSNKDRFFVPGITGRFREQIEKRKLLWQKKEAEVKPAATVTRQNIGPGGSKTTKVWEATTFAQDTDGKVANKFKRLMGIKNAGEGSNTASEVLKKQEEMFSSMEQQYEVARTATHTMRGVGLGFGSFQR